MWAVIARAVIARRRRGRTAGFIAHLTIACSSGCHLKNAIDPWFALPGAEFARMFVDDNVRKCVLFLGTKENGKFSPRATAFVVSIIENSLGGGFHYLVTAQHVISRFHDERLDIWVRSNLKNGRALENLLADRWWFHPDNALSPNDVAVIPIDFVSDEDFLSIPLSGPAAMAATSEISM